MKQISKKEFVQGLEDGVLELGILDRVTDLTYGNEYIIVSKEVGNTVELYTPEEYKERQEECDI